MITNERQLKISKSRLEDLQLALEKYSVEEAEKRSGSRILARAGFDALKSEIEVLEEQKAFAQGPLEF
jgi:hypothetical protein